MIEEKKSVLQKGERDEAREVFKMIFSQPQNTLRVLVDTLECPEKATKTGKVKSSKKKSNIDQEKCDLELDFSNPSELTAAVSKFVARAFDALNFTDNEKFALLDEQGRQTSSQERVAARLCHALKDDPVILNTLFSAVHALFEDAGQYGPLWQTYTDAPALMLAIERAYLQKQPVKPKRIE